MREETRESDMWQSMPASLHCAVWLAWQSLLWRVLAALAPNYTQCRYVSGSVRCPLVVVFGLTPPFICHLNSLCTIVVNSHIHCAIILSLNNTLLVGTHCQSSWISVWILYTWFCHVYVHSAQKQPHTFRGGGGGCF